MRTFALLAALSITRVAFAGTVWLGVLLEPNPQGGVRIMDVQTGSPAEAAKLHTDEILVSIDKHPIALVEDAVAQISGHRPGDKVHVRVRGVKGEERSALITLAAPPAAEAPPASLALTSVAGPKLTTLGALRGKIVVLDFFATWCNPCVHEMPHIRALADSLASKGVVFVGVSPEESATVAGAAKTFNLHHSLVADSDNKIFKRFRVRSLPTVIILDRKGEIRVFGVEDPDDLDRLLAEMVAEPVK